MKIDFFDLGFGILLAGLGIGLCLNWAFQDPVISACEDLVDEVTLDNQQKALETCYKIAEKTKEK
jgi:hypothetical protein